MNRRFIMTCALAAPALLLTLASCNDTTNSNPVTPDTPGLGAPSAQRGSGLDPSKVRLPRTSDAELALAVREDAASANVTTSSSGDLAPHDPTVPGMRVICLDGEEGAGPGFNGEATRFRTNHGCELNAVDGDADPNNNAAFVITAQNRIRGKLLTQIQRLDFFYAGGPAIGGSPRISVPVDECEDAAGNYQPPLVAPATGGGGVTNCQPGFSTDGNFDGFARADVDACFDEENDGDANVGALKGEDDPTCQFEYARFFGVPFVMLYPNFTALESSLAGARVARNLPPFIGLDQANHYLIYRVNIR